MIRNKNVAKNKKNTVSGLDPHQVAVNELDLADRRLLQSALGKIRQGKKPTDREAAVYKRYKRHEEQYRRRLLYKSIPKSDWNELCGAIHPSVRMAQIGRFGMPIPSGKQPVDLRVFLSWLFNSITTGKINLSDNDRPETSEPDNEADRRWRMARAMREEFAYEQDLGMWVHRDQVREALSVMANTMRAGFDGIRKQYGDDIQSELKEITTTAVETAIGMLNNGIVDGTDDGGGSGHG